jgi:hypothetical protein
MTVFDKAVRTIEEVGDHQVRRLMAQGFTKDEAIRKTEQQILAALRRVR